MNYAADKISGKKQLRVHLSPTNVTLW